MLCVNDIHTLFCGSTQVHMLVYVCVCVRTHSCRHTFFRNELHRDLEVIVHPCISLQWIKHCWALCFHRIVQARDVNQGPRRESAQCLIWTTLLCLHRGFFYYKGGGSLYWINNILVRFLQRWKQIQRRERGSTADLNSSELMKQKQCCYLVFVGQDVLEINSFSKVW